MKFQQLFVCIICGLLFRTEASKKTKDFFTTPQLAISAIQPDVYHFTFDVDYQIVKALECGGLGCPFIVQDAKLHKKVVKLSARNGLAFEVNEDTIKMAQAVLNVQNEKEISKKSCPNVLRLRAVKTYGEVGDKYLALLLDYVNGMTTTSFNSISRITKVDLLALSKQLIAGVKCIHQEYQMFHIDIKPQNLMFSTTSHQTTIIDIDGLISECSLKTLLNYDSMPSLTSSYVPMDTNENFYKTFRSLNGDQRYDQLFKKYDEFAVGETLCMIILNSFVKKPRGDKPASTMNVDDVPTPKEGSETKSFRPFGFIQTALSVKKYKYSWIAGFPKCSKLKDNGLKNIFADADIINYQAGIDELLNQDPTKRDFDKALANIEKIKLN